MEYNKIAIVIPARMNASRLPGKPLADINGTPMIIHVMERAKQAGIGEVYVACGNSEIADVVQKHKGRAIMTDPDLPSGTDRVFAAISQFDPDENVEIVINVQGDLPLLAPEILQQGLALLQHSDADIVTFASKITDNSEISNPNVVKIAMEIDQENAGKALYFSRAAIPHNASCYHHHIGIYIFRRAALARFVALPVSELEKTEKLEQLRALSNNMKINVAIVSAVPIGVDTFEDLAKVRILHADLNYA